MIFLILSQLSLLRLLMFNYQNLKSLYYFQFHSQRLFLSCKIFLLQILKYMEYLSSKRFAIFNW